MNAVVRLVMQTTVFAALLLLFRPQAVAPAAWLTLYLLGSAFLALAPRSRRYPRAPLVWLQVAAYAVLLAALFFGANRALDILGTAVKPRSSLPALFGGLELFWVLVPGCFSVAVGAWAGALLAAARPDDAQATMPQQPARKQPC